MIKKRLVAAILAAVLVCVCTALASARELEVWMETWSDDMHKGIDTAISLFEKANSDVKVKKVLWRNSQIDKLIVAIAGGKAPDLALIHGDTLKSLLSKSLGILKPLDRQFRESGLWRQLLPELHQAVTYNGVEYGVPAIGLYPLDGLMWNRTVFAQSALPPLDPDKVLSWDDLATLNKKLLQRNPDGRLVRTGYHPIEGRNTNLDVVERYFGLQAFKDGKPNLYSEGFISALSFLNEKFFLDVGASDVWGLKGPGWYKIGEGLTAVANLGSYGPKELAAMGTPWEFDVTWHPNLTREKRTQLAVWQLVMPFGGRNQEDAWTFAQFMATSYEAMVAINESTGFLGPSTRFLSQYRFRDPLMQWYVNSIINATDLAVSKLELKLPSAINQFTEATRSVFTQNESPSSALLQAQKQLEAEVLRMSGK